MTAFVSVSGQWKGVWTSGLTFHIYNDAGLNTGEASLWDGARAIAELGQTIEQVASRSLLFSSDSGPLRRNYEHNE